MTYLAKLHALVADDAWAISFQTFGQYRNALLKAINDAARQQSRFLSDVTEKCDVEAARIDLSIFIGGVIAETFDGSLSFMNYLDSGDHDFLGCIPGIPDQLVADLLEHEDDFEDAYGRFIDWAKMSGKLGFALKFSTPVMTPLGDGSYAFTWSKTRSKWVYGDSFEEAIERGFEWVAQERKNEGAPEVK